MAIPRSTWVRAPCRIGRSGLHGDLALALEHTRVFGDAAFCILPRADGAEIVGEVADSLVRCRSIQRVLSGALIGDDMVVSVRTERSNDNAARLAQTVLEGLGSGGGHAHRAGGKTWGVAGDLTGSEILQQLRQRWLAACGVARTEGVPLVPRKEISGDP